MFILLKHFIPKQSGERIFQGAKERSVQCCKVSDERFTHERFNRTSSSECKSMSDGSFEINGISLRTKESLKHDNLELR